MSRYYNKNAKSRRERIGFYTAFAICLIAVCMAVYSTYNTVSDNKAKTVSTAETGVVVVNEPVSHVTVPVPTIGMNSVSDFTIPTETAESVTQPTENVQEGTSGRGDALETMLAADVSLSMPTKSGHVLRPFSRDSVYYKTLNTWKPHTGADFDGELGEDVMAMLGGEVTKVYDDKMYGKTVEITVNNVTVGYSGLSAVKVKPGDEVERGEQIGAIGAVPSEASDKSHIHVYVRVNNEYADPLSFIGNDN